MEMYFFNNESKENKRIGRIKEFANKLGITFEDAEMIINNLSKINPKPIEPEERVNNIVSLEKLSKKIVAKNLDYINLHVHHMQPVDPNALAAVVKEILKDALKQTKMIDVTKERMENQELKKQIIELDKDRERLKKVLEIALGGLYLYADDKPFAERGIQNIKKKAVMALNYSDELTNKIRLQNKAKLETVIFHCGIDMGK